MAKIARDLAEEGELALDAAVSRVEPALVLVCSILVGLILLSVISIRKVKRAFNKHFYN